MNIVKIFAISAISLLMACSKQDSEKIEMTFTPKSPKVRFLNGKVLTGLDSATTPPTPKYEEIEPPWFQFKVSISNGTDKNVVVESFTLTMTGLSPKEGMVTGTTELNSESYIPAYDPTSSTPPAADAAVVPLVIASVPAGNTKDANFEMYVSGLPPTVTSGVFNVEVHAKGWFGTEDDPKSPFSQKYYFTTR